MFFEYTILIMFFFLECRLAAVFVGPFPVVECPLAVGSARPEPALVNWEAHSIFMQRGHKRERHLDLHEFDCLSTRWGAVSSAGTWPRPQRRDNSHCRSHRR
jgi:hypothetical protein